MFAQQERTPPLHPRQASFPGAIAQSDSDYGVKIGLEKACPGTMHQGLSGDAVLLVSEAGHYCAANIAGWLGLGADNLITVPTTEENEIDLARLEEAARGALEEGKRIAAFIATLGTTDAFGLDDLQGIAALRDSLVEEFQLPLPTAHPRRRRHRLGLVGVQRLRLRGQPPGVPARTVRALAGACRRIRHLSLADSLGVDFHKTGFAPYVSSLVLVKNRDDLQLVTRPPEQMPYLYHFGDHRPGMYTWRPRGPGPVPSPPSPTTASSASRGSRPCSGISWRWPSSCASTSKGTKARPCSTGTTSAR